MKHIPGDATRAAALISGRIISELRAGKFVLWLVSGGSNVAIAVSALDLIKKSCRNHLSHLFVTLTDERFGPVGHTDSNWKQLGDKGFDFSCVQATPVLKGLDPQETARTFEENFKRMRGEVDIIIGQFGVGDDCHIAGVLPLSEAVSSKKFVVAYDTPKFLRVTLTLEALKSIDVAYAFVFGESKNEALKKLKEGTSTLALAPGLVLSGMKETYLVTDQVL